MGAKTQIAWADSTWPVINGCRRVTEGCRNCYAERLTGTRLKHNQWYAGLTESTPNGPRWTGKWRLNEPHLDDPLRWRDPRWVFPCDRGDMFFEPVPFEVIAKVFRVMHRAHWHRFLVLTKRPERMAEFARQYLWPSNVWAGVSIHDQASACAVLPELFRVRAANYFVSYEPAIGGANLRVINAGKGRKRGDRYLNALTGASADVTAATLESPGTVTERDCGPALGLVIVGGESDQNAKGRPYDLSIPRHTIADCRSAGVPVFNKQLGSCPVGDLGGVLALTHRAGADPAEWPEDLRVQQMPEFG